jgi:hypothetical protein
VAAIDERLKHHEAFGQFWDGGEPAATVRFNEVPDQKWKTVMQDSVPCGLR